MHKEAEHYWGPGGLEKKSQRCMPWICTGAGWGLVSSILSLPPPVNTVEAYHWMPSVLMLPAWLTCRVAKHSPLIPGIMCTRSGFFIPGHLSFVLYLLVCVGLGVLIAAGCRKIGALLGKLPGLFGGSNTS